MSFRVLSDHNRSDIERLWSYCFEPKEHPFFKWYFNNYYASENVIGEYNEAGQLTCCLHLNPYTINLRGININASYIVGLATSPVARRGGLGRKMLKAALLEMRQRKHFISLLMPSRAEFYYAYDWQFCYHQYHYVQPTAELKYVAATTGKFTLFEEINKDVISYLNDIYTVFTNNKNGFVVRNTKDWHNILASNFAEGAYLVLVFHETKPIAYMLYHLKDNKLVVADMAFISRQGQQELFSYIYNHRAQVDSAEWSAALDDNIYARLANPKQGVTLYPFMTARIVDVVEVLEGLSYEPGLNMSITFDLQDDLAEWNNGIFSFIIANGQARLTSEVNANVLKLTIGALTQLVFGRFSASELHFEGKLEGADEEISKVNMLFPTCTNYINEYF